MTPVRVSLRVPGAAPIPELIPFIQRIEAAGFDGVPAVTNDIVRPGRGRGPALRGAGLIGTPEDCAGRLVEMGKLGVRNLYLMPFQTFAGPEPEMRAFRDVVFPRLQAAGLREAP